MPRRFTSTELRILAALEIHQSAGDVARETGAPLNQVIHLQRLYGPAELQQQRGHEDAAEARHDGPRKPSKLHTDQAKLGSAYGPYWRQFLSPPRPVRKAQIVPDDRRDELSFEGILGALKAAFSKEASA